MRTGTGSPLPVPAGADAKMQARFDPVPIMSPCAPFPHLYTSVAAAAVSTAAGAAVRGAGPKLKKRLLD